MNQIRFGYMVINSFNSAKYSGVGSKLKVGRGGLAYQKSWQVKKKVLVIWLCLSLQKKVGDYLKL